MKSTKRLLSIFLTLCLLLGMLPTTVWASHPVEITQQPTAGNNYTVVAKYGGSNLTEGFQWYKKLDATTTYTLVNEGEATGEDELEVNWASSGTYANGYWTAADWGSSFEVNFLYDASPGDLVTIRIPTDQVSDDLTVGNSFQKTGDGIYTSTFGGGDKIIYIESDREFTAAITVERFNWEPLSGETSPSLQTRDPGTYYCQVEHKSGTMFSNIVTILPPEEQATADWLTDNMNMLTLGPVTVTVDNAKDILGDGKASFAVVNGTPTLTLNGVNVTEGTLMYGMMFGLMCSDALTIVLAEGSDNKITINSDEYYDFVGIVTGEAPAGCSIGLTVTGKGTLTVDITSSSELSDLCLGVMAVYGVQVTGGAELTTMSSGATDETSCYGLLGGGNLQVSDGGIVRLSGTFAAVAFHDTAQIVADGYSIQGSTAANDFTNLTDAEPGEWEETATIVVGDELAKSVVIAPAEPAHSHPVCGAACSHSGAHGDVTWKALTADSDGKLYIDGTLLPSSTISSTPCYTLPDGSYYLADNVTPAHKLYQGTKKVSLCLNGKTLDMGENNIDGGTLALCDCGAGGTVTGTYHNSGTSTGLIDAGSFSMYGGKVINTGDNANGGTSAIGCFGATVSIFGGQVISEYDDAIETFYTMPGTIVLSGGPVIRGAEAKSDIYLGNEFSSSKPILIVLAGPLTGTTPYRVKSAKSAVFTKDWSTHMPGEDFSGYFVSTAEGKFIEQDAGGELKFSDLAITGQPTAENGYTVTANGAPSSYAWYPAADVTVTEENATPCTGYGYDPSSCYDGIWTGAESGMGFDYFKINLSKGDTVVVTPLSTLGENDTFILDSARASDHSGTPNENGAYVLTAEADGEYTLSLQSRESMSHTSPMITAVLPRHISGGAVAGQTTKQFTGTSSGTYLCKVSYANGTVLTSDLIVYTAPPPAHSHTMQTGNSWTYDETNHWRQCTAEDCPDVNGSKADTAAHTKAYGKDGNQHWEKCSVCGWIGTKTAHTGGTATCTAKAVCTDCKQSYGDLAPHDFSGDYLSDASGHWHQCKNCTATDTKAAHVYDNDADTTCDTCGYTRTVAPIHDHSWVQSWSHNDTGHWHECGSSDCPITDNTQKDGYAAHAKAWVSTDADGHWEKCDVCGWTGAKAAHVYTNDTDTTCNTCGHTRTVTPDKGEIKGEVETKPDTPPVTVDTSTLEELAGTPAANETITVKLTVEKKDDAEGKNEIDDLITTGKKDDVLYLDLSLLKITESTAGGGSKTENINEAAKVLEIVVPYSFSGKKDVTVYRYHDGAAGSLKEEDTKADGTFSLDKSGETITIYASKFSTYAIAYTPDSGGNQPPSGGGGTGGGTPPYTGGGGGYVPPTYPVELPAFTPGGKLTASPKSASSGATVTLTPTPDEGYELGGVTVTDRNGKPVAVTAGKDGRYTFTMPNGGVTIKAEFVKRQGGYATCPEDSSCPIWPYTDASTTAWYHDALHYCLENGLMKGYGQGLLGPGKSVSRAEFIQMLYNREGRPAAGGFLAFEDVPDGAWYGDAVRWASVRGITGGYGNGQFGPNRSITRQELAVMLHRYAGSPAATDKELRFADADKVSAYAREALGWAVENGIVQGKSGGILDPGGNATRAEAAAMLQRFCGKEK